MIKGAKLNFLDLRLKNRLQNELPKTPYIGLSLAA